MNNTLYRDDWLKWNAFTYEYVLLYVLACIEGQEIKEMFSVLFIVTELSLDLIY